MMLGRVVVKTCDVRVVREVIYLFIFFFAVLAKFSEGGGKEAAGRH